MLANEFNRQKGTQDQASSIFKIKGAEIQQATSDLLMDVIGLTPLPYQSKENCKARNEPPIGPN